MYVLYSNKKHIKEFICKICYMNEYVHNYIHFKYNKITNIYAYNGYTHQYLHCTSIFTVVIYTKLL